MASAAAPGRDRDAMTRKRTVILAVAAVLLLELAGLAAWRAYEHARTGRVELSNDGPPLVIQVLDESGERPIGDPIDLVKQATLALPDGDYRLSVSAVGRLGQTYRCAVNAGETIAHTLSLDEGRLLGGEPRPIAPPGEKRREPPLPFPAWISAPELVPGKADFIEWGIDGIVRRDGVTGEAIWDMSRPRIGDDPGARPRRLGSLYRPAPGRRGDPGAAGRPGRRRHPRPGLHVRRPARLPGPLGEGRFDAVEPRRGARRVRRTAAGRPGASRAGPIRQPGGVRSGRARHGQRGPRRHP